MARAARLRGSNDLANEGHAEARRERDHARGLSPRPLSDSRSLNMRAIRRVDTTPELRLRRALHAAGLRYRVDMRLDLPGGVRVRPDIVFTRRRVAVFVDSCFWHRCPEHGRVPRVNEWFWVPKLARTVLRDRRANEALLTTGWTVVRAWEHEAFEDVVRRVLRAVGAPASGDAAR
jgi:DNA mismatch endonuclease (patch repair protein)